MSYATAGPSRVTTITRDVRQRLTAPDGPFTVTREMIDGHEVTVFADRFDHLRAVAQFAAGHGEAEFLVYGDRRITFTEFLAASNSLSAALGSIGVEHGDRVAVLAQNCPEWAMAFWGTVGLGAILVGLNGWWNTDEILYGLEDSGATVLVVDAKRLERIADELDDIETLEHVYLIDAPVPEGSSAKLRPFAELVAAPTDEFPDTPIDEGDAAVIFYTSGTTGRPKGAISTHRSMVANLQNTVFMLSANSTIAAELAAAERDDAARDGDDTDGRADASRGPSAGGQQVALFTAPLFHVAGCHSTLVVGVLGGVKLVMLEGRFDPVRALELIENERATMWTAVPTMVWRVCEAPERHDFDTSSVISVGFGGSPSADEMQRRVRDTFPNLKATTNAYGLTESSSVATSNSGPDTLRKPDSVGLPMPTVEVAIAGPDGRHLGALETGEVLLRGPILMAGYWNNPEATDMAIVDGWLHTGDVGHLDDEGYLFITDRAKDMLIRGGENVYCVEIENRLVEHPAVADAAVIGVPHEMLGEEVKAVVEVAPGASVDDDELRRWVAETLASFKVPAHIERSEGKLPLNASGKLLKNVLRGEGHVSFAETM